MTPALGGDQKRSQVVAPILVVDDEPDILDVVVMMLEFEGFATMSARNGAEALEIVERERPGLVLLDMRMPGMDGWGFARALKARQIDIPVVVMTAAQNARRWAEEIEADAYVEKPFNMDKLIETVGRVMNENGENG